MESEIIRVQLNRSVLSALCNDIRPELQSQQALHRADLVDMMLARLAADIESLVLASQENTPAESAMKISTQVIDALRVEYAAKPNAGRGDCLIRSRRPTTTL